MKREDIQLLINQGFDIIKDGQPLKIDIDLWEYLDTLDDEENVFVLSDIVKWSDEELSNISIPKNNLF